MASFSRKISRVVDCHVHLRGLAAVEGLFEIRRRLGLHRMNLVCIVDPATGSGNAEGLYAKAAAGGALYCFGGLNHAAAFSGGKVSAPSPARQVDDLLAAGCDGIKLIESKPDSRRKLPQPMDGEYYREFFARAEARGAPLLWHVGDPEEFWDASRAPSWAVRHGWTYGPGDIPLEDLYAEVEHVLDRHPALRVVFAHFYFLSADLPRARRFLQAHPNVMLDLAPGIEFLHNLSRDRAGAREFFIAHQDRIVFGTDIFGHSPPAQAAARAEIIRRLLETAEEFAVPEEADELLEPGGPPRIVGLDLPVKVLEKIYHANFEGLAGAKPRGLDVRQAIEECLQQARIAADFSGTTPADTVAGRSAAALAALQRRV